jgi:outer membrane receptor protein involved in Fe transport
MRTIVLLISLLFTLNVFSQSVKGLVVDQEGKSIEFAKVRVLILPDSTVVGGQYTDEAGLFNVELKQAGEILVEVSFFGNSTIEQNVTVQNTKVLDLGVLKMSADKTLELDGVVATGSLDVLKAGIDKKIYSTSEDLSSKGGTVIDVLNNIPSIEVDQDGNITLRGDANVIILIDGRPSALAMGDGQNLLDAMPANSVERIEVVTNPSAKYDPDGTSGIVNIVLKKNKLKGFNGRISGTAGTGDKYEANGALSYRNKKVNVYTNYSFNFYQGFRNYYNDLYRYKDTDSSLYLNQDRDGTDERITNTFVLGADYSINDRNVIAISGTGSLGSRTRTSDLNSELTEGGSVLMDSWNRVSRDPRENINGDVNVNFTHKFKEELGEWSFNGNLSRGKRLIKGFYEQIDFYDGGIAVTEPTLFQRLENNENTRNFTLQTDLNRIIKKIRARYEIGAKSIVMNDELSTVSETYDYGVSSYVEDTLANFDYAFHFEVHSLYGIWGQELGKFKYQVGVRGEYAVQEPNLISQGEKVRTTYVNVFPSGHLKYNVGEKTEVSLSYSRRINRPGSRQLNPFTSFADPLNLRSGNPYLQPEYIDSYDLGYSFTGKKLIATFSTFHRRTSDVINRVKLFYPDNSSYVTYANIDNSYSTGIEFVAILKLFGWLKNTFSANFNYVEYRNSNPLTNWNNDGLNWRLKNMFVVDFWKKTARLQINVGYNAPWITPQGIAQRQAGTDVAISKDFMDGKLNVTLRGEDIFNRIGFTIDFDRDEINQDSRYKWLSRRFLCTVSFKFGSLDSK